MASSRQRAPRAGSKSSARRSSTLGSCWGEDGCGKKTHQSQTRPAIGHRDSRGPPGRRRGRDANATAPPDSATQRSTCAA